MTAVIRNGALPGDRFDSEVGWGRAVIIGDHFGDRSPSRASSTYNGQTSDKKDEQLGNKEDQSQ